MGFKIQYINANIDGEDIEHDIVLTSTEGRIVVQLEGKDRKPIDIKKLDQLARNVDEDFSSNDTDEYANGLLLGNPYRLLPLEERKEPFTNKVLIAAKRKGFGLLSSTELFNAVKQILENPTNNYLKSAFRKKIFESHGEIITFKDIPAS